MKARLLFALSTALLLAGCANTSSTLPTQAPLPEVSYTEGQLNRESLYELLAAEIAGQRQQYPLALQLYLKQATLTKDPLIAKRAVHIAQYLRQPEDVLDAAKLWINADPSDAEPYQIATSVLIHQGRYDEALPLMEDALKSSQMRLLSLLDMRAQQIPLDAAQGYQSLLEKQLQASPENPNLYRTYGVLLRRQGKLDQSLKSLQRAYKLAPKQADIIVQLADLLRAQSLPKKAIRYVRNGLNEHPEDRALRLLSIQLEFDLENRKAGTKQAQRLIADVANDSQLHLYLSLLMLDADQLDAAKEVLQALLVSKTSDSTPHFYLGHIAQRQEQPEQAIDHYLQVINGDKVFAAFARIAALLDSAERYERLAKITADARLRFPSLAVQLYVLEAEWLNSYEKVDDAVALLEEALTEHTDNTHLLYTRAMLLESSNFAQAEQDLRKILSLEADNAQALNALGYTLTLYTERYDEALALLEQAHALTPNDAAILDSLGWALFKLKRYEEALVHLRKAYDKLPEPEITSHLIQALFSSGARKEARDLLESSIKEAPDNSFLHEARKTLDEAS